MGFYTKKERSRARLVRFYKHGSFSIKTRREVEEIYQTTKKIERFTLQNSSRDFKRFIPNAERIVINSVGREHHTTDHGVRSSRFAFFLHRTPGATFAV